MRSLILIVIVAGLFTSISYAQQNEEKEFYAGMEKVRALISKSRWSSACKKLKALLKEHGDRNYVQASRVDIQDCMATCVFRENFEPPDYKSLISGDLLSYKASTGTIKMRYTPNNVGDFFGDKKSTTDSFTHPALFCGPYTIEIKGDEYPGMKQLLPQIVVCFEDEEFYSIIFGNKGEGTIDGRMRTTRWIPPRIRRWNGKDLEELEEKSVSPATTGKPFTLKVKVGKSDIKAYYNNKSLMSVRKDKSLYGRVGFTQIPFTNVEISGEVQPSWLQGLQDAAIQTAREDFNKQYNPEKHLPEWLWAGAEASSGDPSLVITDFPDINDPEQAVFLEKAQEFFEKEEYQEGLNYVLDVKEEEITVETQSLLLAVFLEKLGRYEDSLKYCEKVCQRESDYYPTQVMRAALYCNVHEWEKAHKELRRLIDEYPIKAAAYCELAILLLSQGDLAGAESVIEEGLGNKIHSRELDAISRILVKVENGPDWKKKHEHESKHYHIYSDIDLKICREAASILEEAYTAYTVHMERTRDTDKEKFPVFLFAGLAGYSVYLKDIGMYDENLSLGCYVPALKQLMIWNVPERDSMMRTIRHEGFHQYLHRLSDDPPLWFNEGLAEYFEIADRKGGKWIWGAIHPDHLRTLKNRKHKLIPLEEFFYHTPGQFMEEATIHYAQSWAFIHFLRHTTKENKSLFEKLFSTIQEGLSSRDAVDKAFDGIDMKKLQSDFYSHVQDLKDRA